MKTFSTLLAALSIITTAWISAPSLSAADRKPNIILIYVDDWGWHSTPIQMRKDMPNTRLPVVEMPNLQRIANTGMTLVNAYGSPQCSPARACIQTGQSNPRNKYTVFMNSRGQDYYNEKSYPHGPVIPCIAAERLPEDAPTIAQTLAPLGYVSAHVGKWHLRGNPGDYGYLLHDGETTNKEAQTVPDHNGKPATKLPADMSDPKLMHSVTNTALGFIDEQTQAGTPFYLQISHYAIHEWRESLIATRDKYRQKPELQAYYKYHGEDPSTMNYKKDPAVYLAMTEDLDGRIGAVLDHLDTLGISDNTYVLLTSDNGYRHSAFIGQTQPLHAHKWWLWEAGIRVPLFITGPGIEGGSVLESNVVNYDYLPTFVEWAGGDPNSLENIDGVSVAPYLAGQQPDEDFVNRNIYFHFPHYREALPHSAVISGSHKVMHFYERPEIPMLFDLANDVGETMNIATDQPETHQRLLTELLAYLKQVDARIPKENPNYNHDEYKKLKNFDKRMTRGPFQGTRPLAADELQPKTPIP